MDNLRLILLFAGIVILAGIYFWGTRHDRKRSRIEKDRIYSEEDYGDTLSISPAEEDEADYTDALTDLNDLLHDASDSSDDGPLEEPEAQPEPAAKQDAGSGKTAGGSDNRLVILYITAPANHVFNGRAIHSALKAVDMHYGDMGIFHHYGVGDMLSDKSLFSLANIVEPGSFDLETIDDFSTPGLVLFTQLPAPVDAPVVFELMLNTAQRLAEQLSGTLLDENREILEQKKIERLRSSLGKSHA